MKAFTTFIICWAIALCPAWGQGILSLAGSPPTASGFTGSILNENMDGVGTPSGWTNTGSPNWDYTTTILHGTESLLCSGASTTYAFSGDGTVDAYFRWRTGTLPGSATSYAGFRTTGGGAICALFRVNNTGQVTVFTNGSDSTACVATMSINTTYHVFISFADNTSNGATVAFSTDGSRPTSGDNFTSLTTTSVGNAARWEFGSTSNITDTLILDGTVGNIPANPAP